MNCIIIGDKSTKGTKSKGWSGLISINKKQTLIQNQISCIKKNFPRSKIYYIYGFDDKRVENYFINNPVENVFFLYNADHKTKGQVHSLTLSIEYLDRDCMILFGDTSLKPSMFKNFQKKQTQIYVSNYHYSDLGCTINDKGNIEHISYDLDNYIYSLYYIHKSNIRLFKNLISEDKNRNLFLFEVMNKMIDSGVKISPKNYNNRNCFNIT